MQTIMQKNRLKASLLFLISLAISNPSFAENMIGLDTTNMREMIAQRDKMQACLTQVDEIEILNYQSETYKIQNELNTLCKNGKREAAQAKAIRFGKKLINSDTFKIIKSCTKNMEKYRFMPVTPNFNDLENHNICDQHNKK